MGLLNFLSNSDSRKAVKKLDRLAKKVEDLEPKYAAMSDEELKSQTGILKGRLANGETLDDILFDAFAALREASWRVLKMKHFHVQIIGGICLHQGRIAEMRTGEGKTLVSTLPAYLNALTGKGVHIVTVNDYLAKRDAEWMGKVHKFMGLTVGVNVPGMDDEEKKKAYACDILYATNNELGFDYLRDNLKTSIPAMVQRELNFCIIDEVDSILIDEARTPLIISGRGGESSKLYEQVDRFVRSLHGGFDDDKKEAENKAPLKKKKNQQLTPEEEEVNRKLEAIRKDMETWDYIIDRQDKTVTITENGAAKAERFFNIKNLGDINYNIPYTPTFDESKSNILLQLKLEPLDIKYTEPIQVQEEGQEPAENLITVTIEAEKNGVYTYDGKKLAFVIKATGVKVGDVNFPNFPVTTFTFSMVKK